MEFGGYNEYGKNSNECNECHVHSFYISKFSNYPRDFIKEEKGIYNCELPKECEMENLPECVVILGLNKLGYII